MTPEAPVLQQSLKKFADEDFNIAKLDQNGYAYRLRLH